MSTAARLLCALSVVFVLFAGPSCNRRVSPFEELTAPTLPAGLSEPGPSIYSVTFLPPVVVGSVSVRGTVLLTSGAPAGGLDVSLSSSAPAVLSLPATVRVETGADRVEFSGTASAVSGDRDIRVTATPAVGRPMTGSLSLWPILPTFFSFVSEPGDWIGGGAVRRMAPPFPSLRAECAGNGVRISLWETSDRWWNAEFRAPKGTPLRVGTYEGATRAPFQGNKEPGLEISGDGRGCNTLQGRFIVREADFAPSGQVRRFWATFEQRCGYYGAGTPPGIFGDIRVTDGPPVSGGKCLM